MSNKFLIDIEDLSSADHSVMYDAAASFIEFIKPSSTASANKMLVKDFAVDQEET